MIDFRFGPAEIYLVGFEGARPDPETFRALSDLVASGVVRVLDFVLLTKSADGVVEVLELEDDEDGFGLGDFQPLVAGLAGEEDVDEVAADVPSGGSAALVVLELTYARSLAQELAAAGGRVLRSERVPAPVVNAITDLIDQEGE